MVEAIWHIAMSLFDLTSQDLRQGILINQTRQCVWS